MKRPDNGPTPRVAFDTTARLPVGEQVRQRIEYILNQVARTHGRRPVGEIEAEIARHLRGLGVPLFPRQIQQLARDLVAGRPQRPPSRPA
ncbi:MAG TPA: hypothetical protein VES42_08145 [Pilimelia sp.]|nr:hypothetical protein [Pilimelia sp.]